MNFNTEIISLLKNELSKELPGETAQYRMAPAYRPNLSAEEIAGRNPRVSAVMVLLYESEGQLKTVFTKRKQYEGVHSGQMSFPGGKQDETDQDLVTTALRETFEEVGVEPHQIEVIGELSRLYIPPSNFLVYPKVGFAESVKTFVPQASEVEQVVEIPLEFFLDMKNINLQTEIKLYNGTVVKVPAYLYNDHIIWGATAIMLSEFSYILQNATSKL